MNEALNEQAKAVFGHDAQRDPVTGIILEQGIGALPPRIQVSNYLRGVEARLGTEAAERALRGEDPEPVAEAEPDEPDEAA